MFALGELQPTLSREHCFVADNARLIGSVHLEPGSSVWFGAVLRGDNDRIVVGRDSNVQDGAILHTDPGLPLTVGKRVTIGHRALLHGCTIGDGSLIGIGSTVLNGAHIGRSSLVGAHALVTEGKVFPDGVLIIGTPARVVRELDDSELAMLAAAADSYVQKISRYRRDLRAV